MSIETRMWADAQHDSRPAKYTWCPLQKLHNSIPCTMLQSAGVPCSNAANIGEHKTWMQVNFVRGKIPSG